MGRLNVHRMFRDDDHPTGVSAEIVLLSAYGMSNLYDEMSSPLDDPDDILRVKSPQK